MLFPGAEKLPSPQRPKDASQTTPAVAECGACPAFSDPQEGLPLWPAAAPLRGAHPVRSHPAAASWSLISRCSSWGPKQTHRKAGTYMPAPSIAVVHPLPRDRKERHYKRQAWSVSAVSELRAPGSLGAEDSGAQQRLSLLVLVP